MNKWDTLSITLKRKNQENWIEICSQFFLKEVTTYCLDQSKTHLPTKKAKLEHRKENANINVPHHYRARCEALIVKHFKVVSIGKIDLGRVKQNFPKIHMKDNEPVYWKPFKIPDAHRPFWNNHFQIG
jgi:hypothetical protein